MSTTLSLIFAGLKSTPSGTARGCCPGSSGIKHQTVEALAKVPPAGLHQGATFAAALGMPVAALISSGVGADLPEAIVGCGTGVTIRIFPVALAEDKREAVATITGHDAPISDSSTPTVEFL